MDGATPPGRSDRGLRRRGRRHLLGALVLLLWLLGWAFGEWMALRRLFFSDGPDGAWFVGLWLLVWTAAGLLALRALLRLLAGREPALGPPRPPDGEEPPHHTDAG